MHAIHDGFLNHIVYRKKTGVTPHLLYQIVNLMMCNTGPLSNRLDEKLKGMMIRPTYRHTEMMDLWVYLKWICHYTDNLLLCIVHLCW